MKSKIATITLITALILAVLVCAFYLGKPFFLVKQVSPASQPTYQKQTKEYSDTLNGFNFQYPANLEITNNPPYVNISNNSYDSQTYVNFSLKVDTLPSNETLEKYIEKSNHGSLPNGENGSFLKSPITKANLNNFQALTVESGKESINKSYYILNNRQILVFTVYGFQTGSNYKDNTNAENVLLSILDTLKFTSSK